MHGSQKYTYVCVCVSVRVCMGWKEEREKVGMYCGPECVYLLSSSHALPQTGNAPLLPVSVCLWVWILSTLSVVWEYVCVYTSSKPVTCMRVCVSDCFTLVFHSRLLCTLTDFTAECGVTPPSPWLSHTLTMYLHHLSVCNWLCPSERWTDDRPLSHTWTVFSKVTET